MELVLWATTVIKILQYVVLVIFCVILAPMVQIVFHAKLAGQYKEVVQ